MNLAVERRLQAEGALRGRPLAQRSADERETLAEVLAARLSGPVSLLGVLFLLLVLGDLLAPARSSLRPALTIATWVIWSVFVLDFVLRMVVAPSTGAFLRRNWWQVIFLLVPFLRFLALLRISRGARALASAVRAGRSAARKLSVRIGWLLVAVGDYTKLSTALHDAAIATIAGEPLGGETGLIQALNVALAAYSVVVFATLAGALGAFFLEHPREGVDERAAGAASRGRSR